MKFIHPLQILCPFEVFDAWHWRWRFIVFLKHSSCEHILNCLFIKEYLWTSFYVILLYCKRKMGSRVEIHPSKLSSNEFSDEECYLRLFYLKWYSLSSYEKSFVMLLYYSMNYLEFAPMTFSFSLKSFPRKSRASFSPPVLIYVDYLSCCSHSRGSFILSLNQYILTVKVLFPSVFDGSLYPSSSISSILPCCYYLYL